MVRPDRKGRRVRKVPLVFRVPPDAKVRQVFKALRELLVLRVPQVLRGRPEQPVHKVHPEQPARRALRELLAPRESQELQAQRVLEVRLARKAPPARRALRESPVFKVPQGLPALRVYLV